MKIKGDRRGQLAAGSSDPRGNPAHLDCSPRPQNHHLCGQSAIGHPAAAAGQETSRPEGVQGP